MKFERQPTTTHRCRIDTTTADPYYPGHPGYQAMCDECGPVGRPESDPRDQGADPRPVWHVECSACDWVSAKPNTWQACNALLSNLARNPKLCQAEHRIVHMDDLTCHADGVDDIYEEELCDT
jgi:hypothetical protein